MPLIFRSKPWKDPRAFGPSWNDKCPVNLTGHETLDQFVTEAKAGIFNLGYLPSADKSVITRPQTTIEALEKAVSFACQRGRIAIMIYYGHEGGDLGEGCCLGFC